MFPKISYSAENSWKNPYFVQPPPPVRIYPHDSVSVPVLYVSVTGTLYFPVRPHDSLLLPSLPDDSIKSDHC